MLELKIYDNTIYRVGTDVPAQHIVFIERIRKNLIENKRFLPHLSTKKRNPRSELRYRAAYLVSHLCHWIDLATYSAEDGFKTYYKHQFTFNSLRDTLGIPWSSLQRVASALTIAGYIKQKRTYIPGARGKSVTQFTLTKKLFNHLGFLESTLRKSAKYAKDLFEHKKREKIYATQNKNTNTNLFNKNSSKKTTEKNFFETNKKPRSLKDYLKSII